MLYNFVYYMHIKKFQSHSISLSGVKTVIHRHHCLVHIHKSIIKKVRAKSYQKRCIPVHILHFLLPAGSVVYVTVLTSVVQAPGHVPIPVPVPSLHIKKSNNAFFTVQLGYTLSVWREVIWS